MSGPKAMVDALEAKVVRSQIRGDPQRALVPERLLRGNMRRLARHHHHNQKRGGPASVLSARLKRGGAPDQGFGVHLALCDVHNMSFEL